MPALETLAADDGLTIARGRLPGAGRSRSEGVRVGARGNAAAFAFYANKQLTTGRGEC